LTPGSFALWNLLRLSDDSSEDVAREHPKGQYPKKTHGQLWNEPVNPLASPAVAIPSDTIKHYDELCCLLCMLLLFFMSKFSSDSSPETFEGQFNFIS
jgi:hypothetical protein